LPVKVCWGVSFFAREESVVGDTFLKERLAKANVWAPYTKVPLHLFQSETLSTTEKMVLVYLYAKGNTEVYQKYFSWDLGISRSQALRALAVLETKNLIQVKRVHDQRTPNVYTTPDEAVPFVAVPWDIVYDQYLFTVEKYACIALFNKKKLKLQGDITQAAKALRISRPTLRNVLNTLHGFNILLEPKVFFPIRKSGWNITNRIAHKEKTNMQWKKHTESKKADRLKPLAPEVIEFVRKLRQKKINKNILFVSELIYAKRNASAA